MSETAAKPAILSISSHVVRGSVGNRGIVHALQKLNFPIWSIPTVVLAWHPGHGQSTKIVPDAEHFDNLVNDIAQAQWTDEIAAILTGYIGKDTQVTQIKDLIVSLRDQNKEIIYLCDPVMGDSGGLYVPEEIAIGIKQDLLPICDILTPNLYELAWLAGKAPTQTLEETKDTACSLGVPTVLVTSVPTPDKNQIGNMVVVDGDALVTIHETLADPPNGTGDLAAALFLANKVSGMTNKDNLLNMTAALYEVLKHSANHDSDELKLEGLDLSRIAPSTTIELLEL